MHPILHTCSEHEFDYPILFCVALDVLPVQASVHFTKTWLDSELASLSDEEDSDTADRCKSLLAQDNLTEFRELLSSVLKSIHFTLRTSQPYIR